MLRFRLVLLFLMGGSTAWAGQCEQLPPISLSSNNQLEIRVLFDNKPAIRAPLQLYAGDTLMQTATADQGGYVHFGFLFPAKYRVVIPRKGTLDIAVLAISGVNGPMIDWFLFPGSTYKWVAGKRVAERPCPVYVLKAD